MTTISMRKGFIIKLTDSEKRFLIELYQAHEALWNISSEMYHRREVRNANLVSIATAFHAATSKDITTEDILAIVRNLRTQYTRELRKIQASSKSGAENRYKSNWIFYDQLNFLKPNITRKGSSCNQVISVNGSPQVSMTGSPHSDSEPAEPSADSPDDVSDVSDHQEDNQPIAQSAASPVLLDPPEPKKRKEEEDIVKTCGQIIKTLNDYIVAKKSNSIAADTEERPSLTFAKHIANELEMIKDLKRRKRTQLKIQQVLLTEQLAGMDEDAE